MNGVKTVRATLVRPFESREERRISFEKAAELKDKIPRIVLERYIEEKPKGKKKHCQKMNVIRRCVDLFVEDLEKAMPSEGDARFIIRLMKKVEPLVATVFLLNIIDAFAKKEDCDPVQRVFLATLVSGIVKEISSFHEIGIDLAFRISPPTMARIGQISASLPKKTRQELEGMLPAL